MKDKTITNYLLGKESFFWTPDFVDTSAWTEHIPFAFWLIETLKPKMVVELGVHNGTSYFSFCQAVKRLNIDTVCYGIDTWKGDEHSGFYEEDVFGKVMDHNLQKYSRFSTLIRSSFDEAKNYFIDGSIDLLHIDGMHSYESVKHDFETWLPKLMPDAIVIFHDINVRDRNFEVFKFWEELKQQYRNFEFAFGHGLGVIAIGETTAEEVRRLLYEDNADEYYIFLRNLFSDRGSSFKNKFDASILVKQERENFARQAEALSQAAENYKTLELNMSQLQETNKVLVLNNNQLQESNLQLLANNNQFLESSRMLAENNEKLKEHCTSLELDKEKYHASVTELSGKLNAANIAFNKTSKALSEQQNATKELGTIIQKQEQIISWYKATYENRSIAGVLKEKLKSRLKKKVSSDIQQGTLLSQVIAVNNNTASKQATLINSVRVKKGKSRYHLPVMDSISLPL